MTWIDAAERQIEEIYARDPDQVVEPDPLPAVVLEDSLPRIRNDLGDCERCRLCEGRRNIVFGVGNPRADVMVIGEAPGKHEDLVAEPFVGKSGRMLDKMIENVLIMKRSDVYITNIVKCRPVDNRNPNEGEIEACMSFLERQIAVVNPKTILLLGSTATRALLEEGVTKLRGEWQDWRGREVMATFHPAYLLRKPQDKNKAFEDLTMLKRRLDDLTQ